MVGRLLKNYRDREISPKHFWLQLQKFRLVEVAKIAVTESRLLQLRARLYLYAILCVYLWAAVPLPVLRKGSVLIGFSALLWRGTTHLSAQSQPIECWERKKNAPDKENSHPHRGTRAAKHENADQGCKCPGATEKKFHRSFWRQTNSHGIISNYAQRKPFVFTFSCKKTLVCMMSCWIVSASKLSVVSAELFVNQWLHGEASKGVWIVLCRADCCGRWGWHWLALQT